MWPRRIGAWLALGAMFIAGFASRGAHAQRSDAGYGAQRFMEYCAGCHGADGRGGEKAPALVSTSHPIPSDAELLRIIRDGTTGGMPPFAQIGENNLKAVIEFVRGLENAERKSPAAEIPVTGDVAAGRALYFGKAQCSTCHLMEGKGGFMAQNLTTWGRNRSADEILRAITNPDAPLVNASQIVTVTTRTGKKLTGALRNEDTFTLALQTEDGRYHLLARSDLADVHYTGHSLMPRDYGTRLSSRELDDLVSFLIVASRNPGAGKVEGR